MLVDAQNLNKKAEHERLAWSIKDGARRLSIGRSTVYKLAHSGQLRLIKIAGRRLIPNEEILRLVRGGL